MELEEIIAYIDGSSSRISNAGGWAFIVSWKDVRAEYYGYELNVTNNAMELIAVLKLLQFLRVTQHPLVVYTDSMYVKNSLTEWAYRWKAAGWITSSEGNSVKNRNLLEPILELIAVHSERRTIDFKWIAGHVGHLGNERADGLARLARTNQQSNWTEAQNRSKLGS